MSEPAYLHQIDEDEGYSLIPSQVPHCPTNGIWIDSLRWCLAVMDADDRDLGFAASLLAHAAGKGGLTEKQEKYGLRVVHRLQALWQAKALSCQQPRPRPSAKRRDLAAMPTEGRA